MNQEKMLSVLAKIISRVSKRISNPLYFEGKGPYLIVMRTDIATCPGFEFQCFECFDVTTEESFLAEPDKFPEAFRNLDFLALALYQMQVFEHQELNPDNFNFVPRKLIPDTPACRKKLEELHEVDSYLWDTTLLINQAGRIVRANEKLNYPAHFN